MVVNTRSVRSSFCAANVAQTSIVEAPVPALLGSMLIGTHYTVDGNTLRIACGPFRWQVPVDAIESVEPTRNPLSSPALSLDRLRIQYGKRKIMVSPADKAGFLKAIGQDPADGRQ